MYSVGRFCSLAFAAWGALLACGARSDIDFGDVVGSGGPDASFGPHPLCASASGVRLCGGDPPCPEIPAPVCPGYGCQHASDVTTGVQANGGICIADLPDYGTFPCYACKDGEACLTRPNGDLVCVPVDVCHALWDIGVRDVCRYADKSIYDDRPLALPSTGACPRKYTLCGGACTCLYPEERCTGRSATRGYGFCEGALGLGLHPEDIRGCSLSASSYPLIWCDPNYPETWVCGVYKNGPQSAVVSRKYGTCIGREACIQLRGLMNIECYDAHGVLVP